MGHLLELVGLFAFLTATALGIEYCTKDGCDGEHCPRTACNHGECAPDGQCICANCYAGPFCDEYALNQPVVHPKVQDLDLSLSTQVGEIIHQVQAVDADEASCTNDGQSCPCARTKFAIINGNKDGLFKINPYNGEVFVEGSLLPFGGSSYGLIIAAYNDGGESSHLDWDRESPSVSILNLYVTHTGGATLRKAGNYRGNLVDGGEFKISPEFVPDMDNVPHHRQKRAAPVSIPGNVTFDLVKTGNYENLTEMHVGTKIHFKLSLHFPQDTVDMLVELFTPDNDTTVMKICGPQVTHLGSNLDVTIMDYLNPIMESKDGSTNYDRAILDFGNVTNDGLGVDSDNQSQIWIEWDAVMIANPDTNNGSTYWVSAGAEYNNDDEIWVGQASFVTVLDAYTPPRPPVFSINGSDEVEVGRTESFLLDMYLPYPSSAVTVDVFAPGNNTLHMSVCSLVIKSVASHWACLNKNNHQAVLFEDTSNEDMGNYRATLDTGVITNAGKVTFKIK